jgi:Putative metal-binding motif
MTTQILRSNFFRVSVAASLLALGLFWSNTATAATPLIVADSTQSLGGDVPLFYSTVTIKNGAVLRVIPVGTPGGTGRLHIKANKIVIEAGGTLDASGAGYRGLSGKDGNGPGGGKYAANYSGGGGGFFGDGGAGTNPMCATGIFGLGGLKYGTVDPPFELGSAGGAGGKTPGPIGGSGGGSVILEAAEIEINGTITVAGNGGSTISGVGSGGGSGGEIRLQASLFNWGPKARLLANGGLGGKAGSESGGSGGGGLIWLRGAPEPPPEVELNVAGGASQEACMTGEGKGQDGMVFKDSSVFACRDLDGDGFAADGCGKEDCDDADPKFNPTALDKCDGLDNNCNKVIDDPETACATGLECVGTTCEPLSTMQDAGPEEDGGTPAAPKVLEYRGGCSVPTVPTNASALAAVGVAVAFGLYAARRRRDPR